MKAVLIDSDVLIEVSRARDTAILTRWDELSRGDTVLLCSPVTIAEIWHGARPDEEPVLDALFASLVCVPIDAEVGRRAPSSHKSPSHCRAACCLLGSAGSAE